MRRLLSGVVVEPGWRIAMKATVKRKGGGKSRIKSIEEMVRDVGRAATATVKRVTGKTTAAKKKTATKKSAASRKK